MKTTVLHADHGVTTPQMEFIISKLADKHGFFIQKVELPPELGTVPCALHGPIMGDGPILDTEVEMIQRSPDRPLSRMCSRPPRQVNTVQAIGVSTGEELKIYTVYGSYTATPREPGDKTMNAEEQLEALKFWSEHALSKS